MTDEYDLATELFGSDPERMSLEGESGWLGEAGARPQAPASLAAAPRGPFGVLAVSAPARLRFRYAFTADDVVWTARFIVGEAGGRDNPDNRAVIWAMFNRYALFTHAYYKTFHNFLRAYSTPLQSVLRSGGAAKRHSHKPGRQRYGDNKKAHRLVHDDGL